MVMPRLSVGKTWRVRAWNPLNMQMENVTVEVKDKTRLPWGGGEEEVYVLEVAHANRTCRAWVSLEGELLMEEFPLGASKLILKKEEAPPGNDRN